MPRIVRGKIPCASRVRRGRLRAHPCARSRRARIVRAPLRAFSAAPCDARHRERRPCSTNPCIPALPQGERSPRRKTCASCCRCFCGRMPPKRGPLWRGERAQGKARRVARTMRASSLSAHGGAVSEPPEHARAVGGHGCPETATPGVCFFGYFLCTSKESGPLARRASGSSAL